MKNQKRRVYAYEVDDNNYPTGKLTWELVDRPAEQRGKHSYACACDAKGNEVFVYCELCGKRRD